MKMTSIRTGFSRRTLLKSLGAGAALAPFLPLLNASGQELVFPKRLLLFFSPDGTASIDDGGAALDWKPTGSGTSVTFGSIHAPLQPHQAKILLPYGLKMSAGGAGQEHAFGMAGLWTGATLNAASGDANFDGGNGNRTGWGSGASIDQTIALATGPECPYSRSASDPMQETPYRTLELGVQCMAPHSMHRMIYKGNNEPIHPETNPLAIFNRLFGEASTQTPQMTDAAAVRRRAQLDLLMAQAKRLRTRVGSEEYAKIDAHLNGLQALAQRVGSTTPRTTVGCVAPSKPVANTQGTRENSATFPAETSAMIELVTRAFACDLTRVASLQLSRGFSNIVHSWAGASQGHHTISHLKDDNRTVLGAIDTWYATQFATLLTALDSVKEGNGTLLDNTLVVWGREMGQTNHRMQPVNLVVAGKARGKLVPGRFLSFNNEPHAKLLVSICQAMGVETNSVGDRNANSGTLTGIL
jgi:hypothetical protein